MKVQSQRMTRKSKRLKERRERIAAKSKIEEEEEEEEEEEKEEEIISCDDSSPWPPAWKPLKESRQYLNGMISMLLNRNWDPQDYRICLEKYNFDLKRFLQQVRDTRGYDVAAKAPRFVCSPFNHLSTERGVKKMLKKCPFFKKSFPKEMGLVLAQINAQAKPHGKSYRLIKVERLVMVSRHRCDLMTFSVKEFSENQVAPNNEYVVKTIQAMVYIRPTHDIIEWRFKPPEATESCDEA